MAAIDPALGALALDEVELGTLILFAQDPQSLALAAQDARDAVVGLTAAGVIDDHGVAPWVANLIAPVLAAKARVVAEVHHGERMVRVARGWLAGDGAVLARDAPGGHAELRRIDPALATAAVAVEVGVGPRPAPAGRAPLTASEAELQSPPPGPLRILLDGRCGSWRLTAERGEALESLAVLDGGEQGLWLVGLPDEHGRVPLTPTDADAVASMMMRMLLGTHSAPAPVAVAPKVAHRPFPGPPPPPDDG